MRVCDCYRQLEPIQLMVGECLGAKNKPRVDCCGDESQCLFYSERRRKAKVKTNADRIRAMSDKELAKLFVSGWFDGPLFTCPVPDIECNKGVSCDVCFLEWLKAPAEEVEG